ncbi:MAG: arylesterase [Rhodothermia bacterium]|nr:MAG: arylesterase [Rhodothermia bacterium]
MKSKLLYQLVLIGVLMASGCSAPDKTETGLEIEEPPKREPEEYNVKEPIMDNSPELKDDRYRVVFLGNSITAGYGVDEEAAFPSLIQIRIDDEKLPFKIVNSGFSGDTSSGGLSRMNWLLRNPIDVLVLELGGNDGLRGIDLSLTRSNLEGIVDQTLEKYPECKLLIAGMMVPPNLGHEYAQTFREIYPWLSEKYDADLIPFILEGVGGVRELNQADGIHPTAEGHAIIAETVWKYLEPVLRRFEDLSPGS